MLRKILFVDDDQILRTAVERHFATHREHFLAVVASDGFEAVKKLQKMPFSLVILDLIMPRMDGMSLVNHMRGNYPDIPIVIISGMAVEKMQELATASDIVAYLSKPFQADDLVATIMQTLRKEAAGGIMHDISPAVFLQLMEMDAKSCTIRVLDKASKQGGILYFIEGQLVDARIGELHGMDAALKVFTWDAVTIFLRNDCPPRKDTINSGLQSIIMKAAGMKDESDDPQVYDEDEDSEPSSMAAGNALGDMELANNFPSPRLFDQAALDVSSLGEKKTEERATSPLRDLSALLEKATGIPCSRSDIRHDASMDKVVWQLDKLGTGSQLGHFQVGYIATGKDTDQILLNGQPPTVVDVPTNSPRDKIIELLRDGIDKHHIG